MQQIPLVDAGPDMILAADVLNGQQMLLLKKGAALNTKNIKMLKSWGISLIEIESIPVLKMVDPVSDRTAIRDDIEVRMKTKFGKTAENDVMREIRRVAANIIMGRLDHQDAVDAG